MRRNVFTDTTVAEGSAASENSKSFEDSLLAAMKVGFYQQFYKEGLITADELEQLLAMQKKITKEKSAA